MDIEREVVDLLGLISEMGEQVEALEASSAEPDEALLAGPDPSATENRSIRTAQAVLARWRAAQMRDGLSAIRERAREVAEVARQASSLRVAGQGPPAGDGRATDRRPAPGMRAAVRAFADAEDRATVLEVLVRHVLALLPEEGAAGVCTRRPDGTLAWEPSSDPVVEELVGGADRVDDALVAVLGGGASVRAAGTRTAGRWSTLEERARALGVRSVLVRGLAAVGPGPALVVGNRGPTLATGWRPVEALADQATIALAGVARAERSVDLPR